VFESPETLRALGQVGVAFEQLGRSIREFASAAQREARGQQSEIAAIPEEREVRLLLERLGKPNRHVLYQAAASFPPGDSFTLEDLSGELGEPVGSLRARLMNLGRTTKSLGSHAPDLFDVTWDDESRVNVYDWNPDAWRALMNTIEQG
jgi:hypothetical protein